ncbi:MAG: hypothetical protein HYR91_00655 [Flavobacteriia bacterium]|nr:hypothetical protein [Flavobacteriia bacterium]
MKFTFLFLSLIWCFSLKSQLVTIYEESDSLKYGYLSGGELDSLDVKTTKLFTNIPGGGFGLNSLLNPELLFHNNTLQLINSEPQFKDLKFTALPHLGFNYAFGSKGTQVLNVDYEHAISSKSLLNIIIQQNSTQGVLKNNNFSKKLLQVSYRRNTIFYTTKIEMLLENKNTKLSGGVYNDSTILYQGLEYANVYNSFSDSCYRNLNRGIVQWENHFDLLKDSSKALGFISSHNYQISSQIYREVFTDLTNYSSYNYDSLKSKDQFRLACISNGFGVFTKTKKIYLNGLLIQKYWDAQNLARHHDTTEISISSNLNINFKQIKFKNVFYFNLIGAKNERSNHAQIEFKRRNLNVFANLSMEQKLPIPYQRNYFSNNYNTALPGLQLQNKIFSAIKIKYTFNSKFYIGTEASSTVLNKNYFFIDSVWRNDTLTNISLSNASLYLSYTIFKITFQPRCVLSSSTLNFNYVPKYNLGLRIFFKTKATKTKKLDFIIGSDVSYISDYHLLNYNRPMEVMLLNQSTAAFHSMLNVNAFLGIGIREFRMYAKMSNIGYFWNDRLNQQMIGYPIQKNLIQLGITWDFFN